MPQIIYFKTLSKRRRGETQLGQESRSTGKESTHPQPTPSMDATRRCSLYKRWKGGENDRKAASCQTCWGSNKEAFETQKLTFLELKKPANTCHPKCLWGSSGMLATMRQQQNIEIIAGASMGKISTANFITSYICLHTGQAIWQTIKSWSNIKTLN